MKIFIAANEYFNIFKFRQHLIRDLFSSLPAKSITSFANFDGYEKKIEINGLNKININFKSRSINPFYKILTLYKLKILLTNEKPDMVITYTFVCNFLFCLLNIFFKNKLIVNITGLGEMYLSETFLKKIVFKLYCRILNYSNLIICQNDDDINILIKNNLNLKKKIKVIYGSGVDTKFYSFQKLINRPFINFLMVGRIIKEKGIVEYITAAKKFQKKYPKRAVFKIIGKTYHDKFRNFFLSQIKGTDIIYKEYSDNIALEISESTCCVLPSYREGMSMFLLEALSIGRPIISSNVPGCNLLVDDNYNGFKLKKLDSDNLYLLFKKINSLSFDELNKFSNNSRLKSKKFDTNTINDQIISAIRSIL